jgi:hypothetical protein
MTWPRASARNDLGAVLLRAGFRPALALVLLALVAGTVTAQARPGWVVQDDVASVEPFAAPAQIAASDASLVVACDADAPDGVNVAMFVGSYAVPLPARLDVLVRIDRQPPRRAEWVTNQETLALPAYFDEVTNILTDLRSGTTFAARVFLFGGVDDAAQPTFQFDVTGFAAIERQLGCGSAGSAADDPFTAAPPAPSVPAAPAAPSGSGLPTAPWEVLGTGSAAFAIADGGRGASLIATCEVESQLPIALVLFDEGSSVPDRAFSVRFAAGDVLEVVDVGDGLYQIVPAGIPALGATEVLIAGTDPNGFDVTAVFADGSETGLLRAAGGEGFFAAWDALPCTGTPASDAPASPSPSTPGRSDAGSTPTGAGAWTLDPTGEFFGYTDARGRTFGFICGVNEDGTPAIFLELPGVSVPSSDGIARFDFARASGVGGSAAWNFAAVGDGLYLTDLVATDDIAFKLLPDGDADPWNTVVVGVSGGAAAVMVVPGEELVANLYTRLVCVQ